VVGAERHQRMLEGVQMKRVLVRIIVSIVCVLLILAFALVFQYLWRVRIPKHQLLGQLHPGSQDIAFKSPKGDHYQIVVGLPQNEQRVKPRVYGTISLKNGTNQIAEFQFDTANCTAGNWLAGENLNAFIVTFPHNESLRNLDGQLAKKLPVCVHIEADGTNVEAASLWLSYLERWMY
jgi:hypothetical protein